MSFLFPKRTYKHLRENFYRFLDIYHAKKNRAVRDNDIVKTDELERNFNNETSRYLGFGWVLSFIPNTEANNARHALADKINKITPEFKDFITISNTERLDLKINNLVFNARAFPSWTKVLILALVTILMVAIALTGIGALAQLGVFGGVLMGLAVTKLAATVMAIVAAKLAASTLTFAAVATGISGFIACLTFREIVRPGDIFRFVDMDGHLPSESKLLINRMQSLERILTFLPLISEVMYMDGYRRILFKDEAMVNVVRFVLNPVRWVTSLIGFLSIVTNRAIEIGANKGHSSSYPRIILKGIANIIFETILTPLDVLATVMDKPFELGKAVFDKCHEFIEKRRAEQMSNEEAQQHEAQQHRSNSNNTEEPQMTGQEEPRPVTNFSSPIPSMSQHLQGRDTSKTQNSDPIVGPGESNDNNPKLG